MKKLKLLLLFVSLSILSCKSTDMAKAKQKSNELKSGNYEVVSLEKSNLDDQKVTMNFDPESNSINGNASCNDYRFEFNMTNEAIKMKPGIATKMYCEDNMETEKKFMKLMSQVKYISQSEDFLYLKDQKNQLLIKAKKSKKS